MHEISSEVEGVSLCEIDTHMDIRVKTKFKCSVKFVAKSNDRQGWLKISDTWSSTSSTAPYQKMLLQPPVF